MELTEQKFNLIIEYSTWIQFIECLQQDHPQKNYHWNP